MLNHALTQDQKTFWTDNGYLHLKQPFAPDAFNSIQQWTNELAAWPETPGKWMKYFESGQTNDQRLLCRIENFVPYHEGYRDLIEGESTLSFISELMGEKATLFKEKINFKLPGGSGFLPHQDAPAFTSFGHRFHITMMIAIDKATVDNGCLEFSDAVPIYTELPMAPDLTVHPDTVAALPWRPLEAEAGDVVFFDSYIPHRSSPNTSTLARRASYITYNRLSEGNVRDAYFEHKRRAFPPECERVEGIDYTATAGVYNLGNPIR